MKSLALTSLSCFVRIFLTNLMLDFTKTIIPLLGGVYMRKLAPQRVSYRHDFLISYRVYMMTGLFHI